MSYELQTLITSAFPPACPVSVTKVTVTPDVVQLQLTTTAPTACCPDCAESSSAVHSRYQRQLTDLPWVPASCISSSRCGSSCAASPPVPAGFSQSACWSLWRPPPAPCRRPGAPRALSAAHQAPADPARQAPYGAIAANTAPHATHDSSSAWRWTLSYRGHASRGERAGRALGGCFHRRALGNRVHLSGDASDVLTRAIRGWQLGRTLGQEWTLPAL
jgi:hypothetical protein